MIAALNFRYIFLSKEKNSLMKNSLMWLFQFWIKFFSEIKIFVTEVFICNLFPLDYFFLVTEEAAGKLSNISTFSDLFWFEETQRSSPPVAFSHGSFLMICSKFVVLCEDDNRLATRRSVFISGLILIVSHVMMRLYLSFTPEPPGPILNYFMRLDNLLYFSNQIPLPTEVLTKSLTKFYPKTKSTTYWRYSLRTK